MVVMVRKITNRGGVLLAGGKDLWYLLVGIALGIG